MQINQALALKTIAINQINCYNNQKSVISSIFKE